MKDRSDNTNKSGDNALTYERDCGSSAEYASPACALSQLDEDLTVDNSTETWESLKNWRKQQRQRLLELRTALGAEQQRVMSDLIIQNLQDSGLLEKQSGIAFYWPMPGEVDLRRLMTNLVGQGISAALPVVTARNQPLEFWRWTPGEPLSEDGLWGIPTPRKRQLVDVGLLLVPMLGFDDDGHRLGFGGGYYDRTIAVMDPAPVCVGVCYEFGHMNSIYPQDHDMPMHAIASEGQVRIFNRPV